MKILVVEDDKLISQSIKNSLKDYYSIDTALDGEEGLYMAEQNIYDLIVLDIMLPSLNGSEILKSLRKKGISTPILLLTAKDSLEDKINGFKIGADDYISKPFHIEELKVRIEALLRRSGALVNENILKCGNLEINTKIRELSINYEKVNLQAKLFDLMEYLINNKGTILTKEQIFDRVWGFESDTAINVVEVYMHKLRKTLVEHGCDGEIKTVRGIGYMFKSSEKSNV
ncbi:response regulator transcription factor [Clostridium coskatii]|uniref:Stage 0 sporulation protein A homolog n=1 Tax=Clostridium coskatii TaxID=1705578 RepID=A0A170NE97_9CLOT|nr:response regulator transcription factor [Clostridium coskatii]OAA85240.1 Response regulator MprA [Clostridium coskatii]OBR92715.1 response regulator MprA [Clostridium coskatii]